MKNTVVVALLLLVMLLSVSCAKIEPVQPQGTNFEADTEGLDSDLQDFEEINELSSNADSGFAELENISLD